MEPGTSSEPSVGVITVTTGRETLTQSIASIKAQTHKNICHYIVTDGILSREEFETLRKKLQSSEQHWIYVPMKVGGPGWEGRRLWSAMSPIALEDAVCFLNDDDWYLPKHIEGLLHALKMGFDWAHSFRKIHAADGTFLFDDVCESLGEAHSVWNLPGQNFAEQNSVLLSAHCYRAVAPYFCMPGWGNDRMIYQQLKRLYPRVATCAEHTMCFRLGGTPYSVSREYLEQGNAEMRRRYPNGFPWTRH